MRAMALELGLPVRSIFVSDTHLGFAHSRAGALLELLNNHHPEHLYLVGDIFDGWRD